MDRRVTPPTWVPPSPCKQALTPPSFINLRHICRKHFFFHLVELKKTEFYEQMTSNLAFTERNVQKANAYRFPCIYRKDIVVGCPWLVS